MKLKDPYKETWEHQRNKKQAECVHAHWIKQCSHCNFVIDSDKLHEETPAVEIVIDSDEKEAQTCNIES